MLVNCKSALVTNYLLPQPPPPFLLWLHLSEFLFALMLLSRGYSTADQVLINHNSFLHTTSHWATATHSLLCHLRLHFGIVCHVVCFQLELCAFQGLNCQAVIFLVMNTCEQVQNKSTYCVLIVSGTVFYFVIWTSTKAATTTILEVL